MIDIYRRAVVRGYPYAANREICLSYHTFSFHLVVPQGEENLTIWGSVDVSILALGVQRLLQSFINAQRTSLCPMRVQIYGFPPSRPFFCKSSLFLVPKWASWMRLFPSSPIHSIILLWLERLESYYLWRFFRQIQNKRFLFWAVFCHLKVSVCRPPFPRCQLHLWGVWIESRQLSARFRRDALLRNQFGSVKYAIFLAFLSNLLGLRSISTWNDPFWRRIYYLLGMSWSIKVPKKRPKTSAT